MALEGRRVLFISYNGMLDPLGQSQVLPYLRELSGRGVEFTLLSFERATGFMGEGPARCAELRASLAASGIDWHWLRYHQTPSLPATIFDVLNGIRLARKLVREKKVELVHARSHIPATIGVALKRLFSLKLVFDVRGLLADEYVDADHWQKGSIAYRLTKEMERLAFRAADGVVTLTESIWPILQGWDGLRDRPDVIHEVVPCCADLELFKFSLLNRQARRQQLGLSDRFVIVYSGSIDGWYLTEKMSDFFAQAYKQIPEAHFLWLTPGKHQRIKALMFERGISGSSFTVLTASPQEVSSYLCASDAGLAFIKPCFSKLASSPTKYAEYLGCGLPLVINAGVGDSDSLIKQEGVGALVKEFTDAEYITSAISIKSFVADPQHTRRRSRSVAERLFDVRKTGVERYSGLYDRVLR